MSKDNESKWPKPEQVDQGSAGQEIRDKRTQVPSLLSEDKAVTEISPKPHAEESLLAQTMGTGDIDLMPHHLSMRAEDTSRSPQRSQEEEPVFPHLDPSASTVTKPQSKHTAVDQSLPLPTDLLTTYKRQNGSSSQDVCSPDTPSSGSAHVPESSNEGKSQFEILNIRDKSSSSSATSQDYVEGLTFNKAPQQVADSQGRSLNYLDLFKGQLQYNHPPAKSAVRESGERGITEVKAGEFPSYKDLDSEIGRIGNLPVGEVVLFGERGYLGRGGFGKVYQLCLYGIKYAVKETKYRKRELNTWSILNHPNVIPLLGVVMRGFDVPYCYQFMPLMSGNLRSMIRRDVYGCIAKNRSQEERRVVLYNTLFVVKEILKGLVYLGDLDIQHSDLKPENILVMKECSCRTLLDCDCSLGCKYLVKIADFDSLKRTTLPRRASQFRICKQKLCDMNGVQGTLQYRAPEQFKICPDNEEFKKVLHDDKVRYDMEGPWCDVWSLGVMLLELVLGSFNKETSINEASILSHYNTDQMNSEIESSVAVVRLNHLWKLQAEYSELHPLACLASNLLVIDCTKRPTASEVLNTVTIEDPPECGVTPLYT